LTNVVLLASLWSLQFVHNFVAVVGFLLGWSWWREEAKIMGITDILLIAILVIVVVLLVLAFA